MPPPIRALLPAALLGLALAGACAPEREETRPAPASAPAASQAAPRPASPVGHVTASRDVANPADELPLERILRVPAAAEANAPPFVDYRQGEQPTEIPPLVPDQPLPEWLDIGVEGGSERIELGDPNHTLDSRRVGGSVGVRSPEGVQIGVEGAVREDRSEDLLPEGPQRDESIKLKIEVPFGKTD
jgi:hypothetical protein